MKMLFQTIGVLLSYNLTLPKELNRLGVKVFVDAENNLSRLFLLREKLRGFGPKLYFLSAGTKYLPDSYLRSRLCNFDLLQINSASTYGKRIMKLCEKPKIFVLHAAPFTEEFYSEIGNHVDVFVAPSKFTLSREEPKIRKFSGAPVIVIHHGIDVTLFNDLMSIREARKTLNVPLNGKMILWNDRISPEKDLETFLRAIPRIAREIPDSIFYIKGRAVVKEYYKRIRYAIDNSKKYNVKLYIGWMTQEKLPFLYRAADVFIRTSLYESFGLGYIEAMACGTPVISSDTEIAREVIGDAGLFYKPNDPESLAEKVIQVLMDRNLRKRLASIGMRRIKDTFTSEIMAKKYFQLYTSLI